MQKEKLRVAVEAIQSGGFTDYLAEAFPREEQLLSFLTRLIIPIATHAHASAERRKMFFELCQTMGIHFLGTGFYSPVPTTSELGGETWSRSIPVHLDDAVILHFLDAVTPFAAELSDVPDTGPDGTFFWKNPTFGVWDSSLYYSVLRRIRPKRVLEVGGGVSTLVAALARRRNPFRLECIEPFPPAWLQSAADEFIQSPVQDVPLERFASLQSGDVLFIDTTHVAKIGSDVVHLYLRILPALNPGVVVHIHDIFLPFEYPEYWIKDKLIFWNEQYVLAAFLQGNREWEVMAPVNYLCQRHPEVMRKLCPRPGVVNGGSFWMRRLFWE